MTCISTIGHAYTKSLPVFQEVGDKATCKKGCSGCCSLVPFVTLPEAIYLADYIKSQPNWKDAKPALISNLRALAEFILKHSTEEAFNKSIKCPLLDEGGTCSVYEARPVVCRGHFVKSAPELCHPSNANGKVIKLVPRVAYEICGEAIGRLMQDLNYYPRGCSLPFALLDLLDSEG